MNRSRIFGIGMQRTGTCSLSYAIATELGIKTCHYLFEDTPKEIEVAEAVFDFPLFIKFKEYDKKYPKSKFIYTFRDEMSWVKSYKRRMVEAYNDVFRKKHKIMTPDLEAVNYLFGTIEYDKLSNEKLLLDGFLNHRESVDDYFRNRSDDILYLKIDDPDKKKTWRSVCEFLGYDSKNKEIPLIKNPTNLWWETTRITNKVRFKNVPGIKK